MLRVVERGDELNITSPMTPGLRAFYLLIGLVPLAAPYELLIKPGWQTIFHPFFALAAIISGGAVAVSALFVWISVAGIESSARFDRRRRTLTTVERAPIMPTRTRTRPLDELRAIEVEKTEWSDSGPTYSLRLECADGQKLKLLASYARPEEAEAVRRHLGRFLAEPSAD
jgi:hypothetical protein